MATEEIPVRNDIPNYDIKVTLDAVVFTMDFTFNERSSRWVLTMKTNEGDIIVEGIPMLTGVALLNQFKDSRLPPGTLFIVNFGGSDGPPVRDDFGENVKLLYDEAS